jgi:hypothetical protein
VELKNTIYEDIKITSSLMRRMSTLKPYSQLKAIRTYKLTGNNLKEQMKVLSRLLGIDDRHIITIKRFKKDLFTSIPKPITSVTTLTLPPKPLQDCTTSNKGNQPILKHNLPSSQSKPTQVISSMTHITTSRCQKNNLLET